MCRLMLVAFVVFLQHSSCHPFQDSSVNEINERVPRQLDFKECCPCTDKSRTDYDPSDDPYTASSNGVYSLARDAGDCPCRYRDADSLGSSSMFFPKAIGDLLRPDNKKEDLKPLFNPEVGLASSVLQTLHEATDREYQEALVRDAARSAKAAENFILGEPAPHESGKVLSSLLNPNKDIIDDDDIIPQASHTHQSRCIHPLGISRSNLGDFKLPKTNLGYGKLKSPKVKSGILHRNFDMDNGMGASNVHEQIVAINEDTDARESSPLKILETDYQADNNNNADTNFGHNELPRFRSYSPRSKLKDFDLSRSKLLQSIRERTADSFSRIPKLKLGNLFSENDKTNKEDLIPGRSVIDEVENINPLLKPSSPLDMLKPKTPLSLTNLLNLKDVEFVPLKELISKKLGGDVTDTKEIENSLNRNNDNSERSRKTLNRDIGENRGDTQESPSNVNTVSIAKDGYVADFNCDDISSNLNSNNHDFIDNTKQESLETLFINKDDPENKLFTEDNDSLEDESNNNTNIPEKILIVKEDIPTKSFTEDNNSLQDENNVSTDVSKTFPDIKDGISKQPEDCSEKDDEKSLQNVKSDNDDSMEQSATNQENKVMSPQEGNVDSIESNEVINQTPENNNNKGKLKLLDLIDVDKKLSTLKENIAKKMEDMKNIKKGKTNPVFKTTNEAIKKNDELTDLNKTDLEDCQNEASEQNDNKITTFEPDNSFNLNDVTSTITPNILEKSPETSTDLKPVVLNDNEGQGSECTVSMQDLQKLSDSMLQHEEQGRDSDTKETNNQEKQVVEPLQSKEISSEDASDNLDKISNTVSEKSENTQQSIKEISEKDTCKTDISPTSQRSQENFDANAEASELIVHKLTRPEGTVGAQPTLRKANNLFQKPMPHIGEILKLPVLEPLPMVNDFAEKVNNLFNINKKEQEIESLETNAEPNYINHKQESLDPVMATDASTPNFERRLASSKLLKDLNLDGLQPQSNLFARIPKIDLNSYKLPLPKDIPLRSIKNGKKNTFLDNDRGLLSSTSISNLQNNKQLSDIFKDPLNLKARSNNGGKGLFDPINDIQSVIQKTRKSLDPKLGASNKNNILKSPLQSSSDFLNTLSRNHEDMNDKLKGIHADLQDRIESMHNEIIDRTKSLTAESNKGKPSLKSSSSFRPDKKAKSLKESVQTSNRKQPQNILIARKEKPSLTSWSEKRNSAPSKLRMPAAASMLVPKTVETPKLEPSKLTPLTSRRGSLPQRYTDASNLKETLPNSDKAFSNLKNKNLKNKFNLKKDKKIVVSFSTTPRPDMSTGYKTKTSSPQLQNGKLGRGKADLKTEKLYNDHFVAPSQTKYSDISIPTTSHLSKEGYPKVDLGNKATPELSGIVKDNGLKSQGVGLRRESWPRSNSMQTRLSSVKLPKVSGTEPRLRENAGLDQRVYSPDFEMSRAASENTDTRVDLPIKDKVSFKCRLVCDADK